MIRKDEAMAADWSPEKVSRLLPVQEALLEKGYSLLKKGGILAYSTCSLSVEEDEDQITAFLKRHPQAEEIKVKVPDTIITGKAGYHLIQVSMTAKAFTSLSSGKTRAVLMLPMRSNMRPVRFPVFMPSVTGRISSSFPGWSAN
jgi:16S rRNA C967 or C1407 C5-methylase (RsmB/RsmF family)